MSAFSDDVLPPEYRALRVGGARLVALPEALDAVRESLLEAGSLYRFAAGRPGAETLEGRVRAYRLRVGGAEWLVRHYRRGGPPARWLGDRYLSVGTPRPVRELLASAAVRERGVDTPEIVALVVYPAGPFYRADIATRYIRGSEDLAAILFGSAPRPLEERLAALEAAGALLRRLVERGVIHPDLNLKNLLLDKTQEPPRPYLLDLDRCRVADRVSRQAQGVMRRRLGRSLRKWEERSGRVLGREERAALEAGLRGPGSLSRGRARSSASRPAVAAPAAAGLLRSRPREILIVMMSAIGDTVQVLPVANALKRAWPDTRITWLIQPLPHQLFYNHPAIDSFLFFRRRRGLGGWRSFYETGRALRHVRFDLVLGLQVYFKAGVLTALARSPMKLGFDRPRARDLNWLFTTHRIPARPTRHVQDQYFEFLEALGVDPEPVEWGITFTKEERERQREFFEALDRPACAVVVGTSKPEKNWAPERYARLLERIEGEFGLRAVLVGGPSPDERAIADRVLELTEAQPLDALGDDLRRLVWLLDGSALVVSPDTGPLHIARALDVPVVGLYGYTNPRRHGPYRKYGDLVVDGYARFPGEEYAPSLEYRPGGMRRVTVEAVGAKIRLALERYVPARDSAAGRAFD